MKSKVRKPKQTELTSVTLFDKNTPITFEVKLKKITLVGGLINNTVPTIIEIAGQDAKSFTKVRPILPFVQKSDAWLADQYKRVVASGDEETFLNFLQIGDDSITAVECASFDLRIYRGRVSESLYLADHALNRLALAAFSLINHKFLAISEIENGIYPKSYEDLWINLFEMSSVYDAQIIATTHSTKMIEIFAKVSQSLGKDEYYNPNTYVEIARKEKTGELVGIETDADTVLYALERGEDIQGGNGLSYDRRTGER